MIIAALAARCVAANSVIDLFNVAFDAAEAPDRESACAGRIMKHTSLLLKILLATSGFIELCDLFPSIRWRLYASDVTEEGETCSPPWRHDLKCPFAESSLNRRHILSLMQPCRTNMDLSISTALWFASRGAGVVYERHHISDSRAQVPSLSQKNGSKGACAAAADAKRCAKLRQYFTLLPSLTAVTQRATSQGTAAFFSAASRAILHVTTPLTVNQHRFRWREKSGSYRKRNCVER
jgi:hypothetical protein